MGETVVDVFIGFMKPTEFESLEYNGQKVIDLIMADWERSLKSKREKIIRGLQKKIPDEDAYVDIIVGRSNKEYEKFIGTHPEKDEIMLDREVTMIYAKSRYIGARDNAFVENGDFETGVTERKEAYKSNMIPVWCVTGYSPYKTGATEKLTYILQGKFNIFEVEKDDSLDVKTLTNWDKPLLDSISDAVIFVQAINRRGRLIVMAEAIGMSEDDINRKFITPLNGYLNARANALKHSELESLTINVEKNATLNRYGIRVIATIPTGGT